MSVFYAIGGPNGAGKTTFMKSFFDDKIPVLRPDDLGIDNPFDIQEVIQQHLRAFAANRQSFAFEHNFHTQSSYRYFDWAKKKGYQTRLLFLAIADVQICLDRVNERFISGRGHFVDEVTIRQRYQDSLFNLRVNLKNIDEVAIIDNTNFAPPKPCLVFKSGHLSVIDSPPTWLTEYLKSYL